MARTDDTPLDRVVPEVDRLEQEQPADPRVIVDEEWPAPESRDADEADRFDQAQDVVGDPDEEYEPDPA